MKSSMKIVALLSGLALLEGCGGGNSMLPTGPDAIASNVTIGSTASATIVFDAVQYEGRLGNPNLIIPCVSVLRGLRTAALAGDKFLVSYTITYLSGGQEVTITAVKRLSESHEHPHESRLDLTQYIELSDEIDVSDQPPDDGSAFHGTATLLKEIGGIRTTVAESVLGGQ